VNLSKSLSTRKGTAENAVFLTGRSGRTRKVASQTFMYSGPGRGLAFREKNRVSLCPEGRVVKMM